MNKQTRREITAALLRAGRRDLATWAARNLVTSQVKVSAAVAPEAIEWLRVVALKSGGYKVIPLSKSHQAISPSEFADKRVRAVLDKTWQTSQAAHNAGQKVFRNAMVST